MIVEFEHFIPMLLFVVAVGEVVIQLFKNKLGIDKMLYSIIVFVALCIFTIIYDLVAIKTSVNCVYVMDAVFYFFLCVILPIGGYEIIDELLTRLGIKK